MHKKIDPEVAIETSVGDLKLWAFPLTRGQKLEITQLTKSSDVPDLPRETDETDVKYASRIAMVLIAHTPPENVDLLARFLFSKIDRIDGVDDIENYLLYGDGGIVELWSIAFALIALSSMSENEAKNSDSSLDTDSPTGETAETASREDASTSDQ